MQELRPTLNDLPPRETIHGGFAGAEMTGGCLSAPHHSEEVMGRAVAVGAHVGRDTSAQLEAVQQLEEVAHFLDLEKWIVQRLQHAEREVQLNLQISNDQNEPRIFRAARVLHSTVRGPGIGPLKFSRSAGMSDLNAAAMEQSWQCALWNLPFCGSAGLITAELDELSERETRLLTREYVTQLHDFIGPHVDIITSERHTFRQVMAWASTALGRAQSATIATVTGKPMSMGGVDGQGIVARCQSLMISTVLRQEGIPIAGSRIGVLGFDQQSHRTASELQRAGAIVVAVADHSGAIHDSSGLNIPLLIEHMEREKMIFGYPEAAAISYDEMLDFACDVLILSGPPELLRPATARFIFEAGARMCALPGSRTQVVPSLLADFGLTFASFCEWRKNTSATLAEAETLRALPAQVRNVWREVHDFSQRHALDLRRSALAIAVSRMAEALRVR
jgi:glutamate dehydrogenase (NAD(P)+)